MDINKTYNEDCRDTITRMPDNFLDMVVTSPPYGELREYDKCVWNLDLSLEIITKTIQGNEGRSHRSLDNGRSSLTRR